MEREIEKERGKNPLFASMMPAHQTRAAQFNKPPSSHEREIRGDGERNRQGNPFLCFHVSRRPNKGICPFSSCTFSPSPDDNEREF
ncbi:hypothetical protein ACLOJK_003758 [Asimina triloba]